MYKKVFSNEFNFLKVCKHETNFLFLNILSVAQKRQSSARKQRLASRVSNGHLAIETERLANDNDEQHPTIPSPSHTESIVNYSDNPIHNSQSTPLLNRSHHIHNLNNDTDSYSFTDIEVASSTNEEKRINQNATPKSIISHNISSGTTNLSTYSTQSLLRKLLDKAQVLDEYYNDISNKTAKQPPSSLSSSSHSLLGRSGGTSRPFHRNRSTDSIQKSQRRKYRNLYDNVSSDSSRFNLYDDEDNILRELIRFNNDIDLILSRLEMEGENLQQQQQSNENLIQQPTTVNPTHQSIPDICPQINDQ
jgi:hypothetical protein